MQESELQAALSGATFKFAKSMPLLPHWYTLRQSWPSNEIFEAAVAKIRELGTSRTFGKRKFIYYDFGGYTYWTMGDTIPNTILINRAERNA